MSPTETSTSDTHLAERKQALLHYTAVCLNYDARRQLVNDRNPHYPRYVYHLWIGANSEKDPEPVRRLWRTYGCPELAKHDAVCWLIAQQDQAGASTQSYCYDEPYEQKYEGRCFRYCTTEKLFDELRLKFYAWTNEVCLY
jgi:hypothetical protein